jgi:hypothetical protein
MRIGLAKTVVDDALHRPEHPLFLGLGVNHPLGIGLGAVEHRAHDQAGTVDALAQLGVIGGEVLEIGRVATPLSIAALATASGRVSSRRGSNGLGIRYSGPKVIGWSL